MKRAFPAAFKAPIVVALLLILGIFMCLLLSISVAGSSGWNIDLFCQNGGRGSGVAASSPFIVGSRIILFAYVTYNQEPVGFILVAFQVNNPEGSKVLVAVEQTNSSGYATTNFTISEHSYASFPSVWEAIVTTSPAQRTVNDTMQFLIIPSPTVGGISQSATALARRAFEIDVFVELLTASALAALVRFRKRTNDV